jgi:DNA-binding MarR family transcriptional regulator
VAAVELTPPQAGMLRLIARTPGLSQQALAERLGIRPNRIVGMIDDLESRALVERTRNREDRRLYALTLTDTGAELLRKIGTIAREHDRDLCEALSDEEHEQLATLLRRVAESHKLPLTVHVGYRDLN